MIKNIWQMFFVLPAVTAAVILINEPSLKACLLFIPVFFVVQYMAIEDAVKMYKMFKDELRERNE